MSPHHRNGVTIKPQLSPLLYRHHKTSEVHLQFYGLVFLFVCFKKQKVSKKKEFLYVAMADLKLLL